MRPTLHILGPAARPAAVQQVAAAMGRDHEPTLVAGEVDGPRERSEDVGVKGSVGSLASDVDEPVRAEATADALDALLVPVLVEPVVGEVRRGLVRGILGEILREGPVLAVEQSRVALPVFAAKSSLLACQYRRTHGTASPASIGRCPAARRNPPRVPWRLRTARTCAIRPARAPRMVHPGPLRAAPPTVADAGEQYRLVGSHEALREFRGGEIRCVDRRNVIFALRQRHHLGLDVRGPKGPARGRAAVAVRFSNARALFSCPGQTRKISRS